MGVVTTPFILTLVLVITILSFLTYVTNTYYNLTYAMFILLTNYTFFTKLRANYVTTLILTFLISPFKLPTVKR